MLRNHRRPRHHHSLRIPRHLHNTGLRRHHRQSPRHHRSLHSSPCHRRSIPLHNTHCRRLPPSHNIRPLYNLRTLQVHNTCPLYIHKALLRRIPPLHTHPAPRPRNIPHPHNIRRPVHPHSIRLPHTRLHNHLFRKNTFFFPKILYPGIFLLLSFPK